jgi:PilZ domain-containing protein
VRLAHFDEDPNDVQEQAGKIVTEKRRYPRFKLGVDVMVRSKTLGLIPGTIIEISEAGMSAILPVELALGETLELHVNLPFGSVDVQAVVRNRNAFRYGFEFTEHEVARERIAPYLHS